jgi:membrane protein implicated in regulation of membrane protease activity
MSKVLIILGAVLILIGLIYPYLHSLGLGRLPGDIVIKKENFNLYFPVTSAIIISIVLSVFFRLFR